MRHASYHYTEHYPYSFPSKHLPEELCYQQVCKNVSWNWKNINLCIHPHNGTRNRLCKWIKLTSRNLQLQQFCDSYRWRVVWKSYFFDSPRSFQRLQRELSENQHNFLVMFLDLEFAVTIIKTRNIHKAYLQESQNGLHTSQEWLVVKPAPVYNRWCFQRRWETPGIPLLIK